MNVRIRNESRPWLLFAVLLLVSSGFLAVQAAKLNPSGWSLINPALTDNNLATFATSTQVSIDFGVTNTIDRVYLTGTNRALQYWHGAQLATLPPLGVVNLYAGNTTPPTTLVTNWDVPYDAGNPADTEINFRFSPIQARYIRVLWTNKFSWQGSNVTISSNVPLRIAEMQVYGYAGIATNRDCVVESANSVSRTNAPLDLAALELSYYLSQLEDYPVPIVSPSQTNSYPGTIYNIQDLKPLAPDYSTMMANIANGSLPTNVTVLKSGREVVFTGWPYRDVLSGVWYFLNFQGVQWLYPDAQGDYVPYGNGVNLSVLPINYQPSAWMINAGFDTSSFEPWYPDRPQSLRDSYLYPWRNHFNFSQYEAYGPIRNLEIPRAPSDPGSLNSDYTEGFGGHQNFTTVIPNRILEANPSWWGYNGSNYVNPTNGETITFQMCNPNVINWVANKMVAVAKYTPKEAKYPLSSGSYQDAYELVPNDGTRFSQDPYDVSNNPIQSNPLPYSKIYANAMSGMYFTFVNAVASNVMQQGSSAVVGALAYADYFVAPSNISSFAPNVRIELCQYGAPGLPMSSPANALFAQTLKDWSNKCSNLAEYDFSLLQTDYWQQSSLVPVPMVEGIVDHAKYLASLGALNGLTQATVPSIQYNPWNFYAWPQSRWSTNQTAAQIESNFFNGFFRESARPMLAYYTSMEDWTVANNVNLHYLGYCYAVPPGSFPVSLLWTMQTNLNAAISEATNWVTISRLNDVQASFDWLLTNRFSTPTSLTNYSLYPTISTSGTNEVDLSTNSVQKPTRGPWGNSAYWSQGNVWDVSSMGAIQVPLYFPQGGTYQVTITAKRITAIAYFDGFLGPTHSNFMLTNTAYSNCTFTATVPSGVWDVGVVNNTSSYASDVNQIQIVKVGGTSSIQVTPGTANFGAILTGTSATSSFSVQNTGSGTLSGSVSVGAPFTIVSGGSYNLGPGQSQTVTVSFNPTSAGNFSQNVILTGGGGKTVSVTGSATNPPMAATIIAMPGTLDLGTLLTGESSTASFIVQNVGSSSVNGTASVAAPFSIVSGGSYNLSAYQSQTVTVSFNPAAAGSYAQSVVLTGGGGTSVAVSGSATNAAPLPAAIQANPSLITFGPLLSGTSKTLSFTVQNVGGGTLSGTATVSAPFSIVSGSSYNLAANAGQTVTVAFNPTAAGTYSQNVTLTGGGGARVSASGSATNAPPSAPSGLRVVSVGQ